MKNNLLSLIILSLLLITGCKKNNAGGESGGNHMKATVDGKVQECNIYVQALLNKENKIQLLISGRWGVVTDPKKMGGFDLHLYHYSSDKTTYTLGANSYSTTNEPSAMVTMSYDPDMADKNIYGASINVGSGKITVTSTANNVIKGTFEFSGENTLGETKSVTNGSFQAKIE